MTEGNIKVIVTREESSVPLILPSFIVTGFLSLLATQRQKLKGFCNHKRVFAIKVGRSLNMLSTYACIFVASYRMLIEVRNSPGVYSYSYIIYTPKVQLYEIYTNPCADVYA